MNQFMTGLLVVLGLGVGGFIVKNQNTKKQTISN